MESLQVIDVIETLANGIDPVTGEVFQYDSPYNHPTVIRALFSVLVMIRTPPRKRTIEQRQAVNSRQGLPRNYGMPWTRELLDELLEQFNAAVKPAELAAKYERSESSIVAQLIKLGAMKPEPG